MNSPFLPVVAITLLAICSCSRSNSNAGGEKVLVASQAKSKLRLTKADPSRFLPEGTSVNRLAARASKGKATNKQSRLLANNTKSNSGPRPSKIGSASTAEIPPLKLPPLPEPSEDDGTGFGGILPSLDGSNEATFIDVNGETPELPPLEFPEPEEAAEQEVPS